MCAQVSIGVEDANMLKTIQTLPILLLCVMLAGPTFAEPDPTVHQVYEAAQSGHLAQAQQMMDQVLRDHPRSAKAHYVSAELYTREGRFPLAQQELNTAQRLDPSGSFASPAALLALRNQLSQAPAAHVVGTLPSHGSFSWTPILLVIAGVGVLMFVWRRRSAQQTMYPQYSNGMPANAPASFGGPGVGVTPGVGSGLGSSLASGLAVGAGVVAGEELAHHFLDSDRRPSNVLPADDAVENPRSGQGNSDLGGNDFGVSGGDSWDDSGDSSNFGGGGGGGDDWS
jgi:hypothetical protein